MKRRTFAGLDVYVENEKGTTRYWHDRDGRVSGQTEMLADYGFLDGHVGADGDEVDVYLGPHEDSGWAFVVHQMKAPDYRRFDEDKCVLGCRSEQEAKALYLAHRNDGERAYGGMSAIPLEQFKAKLRRRTGTGKIRHEYGGPGPLELPEGHKAGMRVPRGGSSCASCRYLGKDQASCGNQLFQAWSGGTKLPAPADEYCSDWYEPFKAIVADDEGQWMPKLQLFRIEKRGDSWVVLPESGDKILGTHRTKEDALKQLRAIEAAKTRGHETPSGFRGSYAAGVSRSGEMVLFDAARGRDGKVRTGVWDKVCVPGHDKKDDMETVFDERTLSQMVDNIVARGDLIMADWNHQGQMAHANGQPAPALAWYGAFAVVSGGKLVRHGGARGVEYELPVDLPSDGLWAYRCEVTELGNELLPNFKYLSPTFTPEGTDREGNAVGYSLISIAATNTPHQPGTEINFDKAGAAGSQPRTGGKAMAKLAALQKFTKLQGNQTDEAIKAALLARFEEEAKMEEDEGPGVIMKRMLARHYEGAKAAMAAEQYDEAGAMLEEADELKKQMAKHEEEGEPEPHKEPDGDEPPVEHEEEGGDKEDEAAAKLQAMEAANRGLTERLAKLEKREADREAVARKQDEARFEQLADAACAGGYDKAKRAALIKFARSDFDGARACVASFLPKGAPAQIFDRLTANGGPVGYGAASRTGGDLSVKRSRRVVSMDREWIEDDFAAAEEIKKVASLENQDAQQKARVDAMLTEKQRPLMFHRLLAAEKIVRKEQPHLFESAEG